MRKNELLSLIVVSTILLPLLMSNITPVSASEEEEFDGFSQMPNYRWHNETTTSGVTEQQIGDQYESYAYNNETSGTSNLVKSRELNTRDFHFDTRFALDIGGNETEYFRDVLADACDFVEDDENVIIQGSGVSLTQDSGLLYVVTDSSSDGFRIDLNPAISDITVNRVEIRYKVGVFTEGDQFLIYLGDLASGKSYFSYQSTLDDKWNLLTIELGDFNIHGNGKSPLITYFKMIIGSVNGFNFYVDSIKIITSLDFASHVEGEVEDTWDWEDSTEYWYDEFDNVSDFEDGTTENWEKGTNTTYIAELNGNLDVLSAIATDYLITNNVTDTGIDSAVYHHFTFEFEPKFENLSQIDIYDYEGNQIGTDSTGWIKNEKHLVSFDLSSDGDWTGTENGTGIKFTHLTESENGIWINFTYLYDCELGDLESTVGLLREHVNPEGYYTGTCAAQAVDWSSVGAADGLEILSAQFQYFDIKIRSFSNVKYIVWGHIQGAAGVQLSSQYTLTAGVWDERTVDLSLDSDWIDNSIFDYLYLAITDDSGNLEGNEIIQFDYWLLTGHYSETDGFKFSLLNQNHEEGMYFQFTREGESDEYTLDIDMLDSSGIALDYAIDFNYSLVDDGFLRLDVDWHLDKKEVKVKFSYDNLTKIVNTRTITDLYPHLGSGQLKLLEEGFPTLCINNSVGAIARSLVIIDYIDSEWKILDWREPSGDLTIADFADVVSQSSDSAFDSISPYNFLIVDKGVALEKWYRIDIDRFDGLTFSVKGEAIFDSSDNGKFYFLAYNVHNDGTREKYISLKLEMTYIGNSYVIHNNTDTIESNSEGTDANYTASFSVYYESSTKIIMQMLYEGGSIDVIRSYSFAPVSSDEPFTKEMVFEFGYTGQTSFGSSSDDFLSMSVSGFNPVRKDLFGDIVAAVINPVFGLFETFILAPLLALLGMLGKLLTGGFQFVVDLLSPLLTAITAILGDVLAGILEIGGNIVTAIGAIAGDVADAVWSGIEGTLEFLTLAIAAIVTDLVALIGETLESWINTIIPVLAGLAETLADIAFDIIDFLIVLLIIGVDIIVDLIAATIFFIWDSFFETVLGYAEAPDLIAIASISFDLLVDMALGAPAFLTDLITLIFTFGMFIALGMFAYNWLIPAFEGSFGGWLEKFIEIALKDVTGGVSILGFAIPVPFVLVWVSLLSLNAAGLIPSGF